MRYKNDWERARQKFLEYWNKENHDRPLIAAYAPKAGYVPPPVTPPKNLTDQWLDMDYVIHSTRESMAATHFGGEAFPFFHPNLGPDIFGAFLGCELEFGKDTSWSKHFVTDWDQLPKFNFDPANKWWKKIVEITEAGLADSQGDYLVAITDLHPGLDGLVSLRGPEELCMDLYDHPEAVKARSFEALDVFKKATDELHTIITRKQEGSTNWMGVWHPDKWYVTSSDFICMISQDMFEEFAKDEILAELDYLDASLFHLDGPGALKHLDSLLAMEKLNGIQWVYGAGQPTAAHWIPVLKKIQDAGKMIHVYILPEELDVLMENLRPEGVMYVTECKTQDDAENLIRKAEKSYRKKLF